MESILILLIIGLPWIGALIVWLVGDSHPKIQNIAAILFSLASGAASLALLPSIQANIVIHVNIGGAFGDFTFVPDGLGVFLACVATLVGSLAVIFSVDYMHGARQLGRYYAFVLFFIGAMAGLVLTNNLMLMFFFWEITALCSYALISFHNDDPKAVAGGVKALIMTQLGGIGLLFGALLVYSQTGSLQIDTFLEQAGALTGNILSVTAFGFLFAAAAKSAQFPFQTWLPDAMEAPSPISALIHAATMVNAGVYLLARFYPAFEAVPYWREAVVFIGAISALLTAVMAIFATDLKRVLAYSTVSQLGYMVYAIGAGGVFASQFHLLSHSIFKAMLFLAAGGVIHTIGTRDMTQMGGLGKRMPFFSTIFVIGALALAGVPILNGFWSKELILEEGLYHGPLSAYWIMVLSAGLTALYTARMVWMVFFGEEQVQHKVHATPFAMMVALIPLGIGTLTSWLSAGPFGEMLSSSLPFHDIHVESTTALALKIISTPATYLALGIILLGAMGWFLRSKLVVVQNSFKWLADAARENFGFEYLNSRVVVNTNRLAESMRHTQTGFLNWNVFGIVLCVLILIFILVLGA